ncbi:MAG: NifU family protein [Hyphomicrobiales bacterium]|nr:NifU family protein [Hyphomicrobiales bacterium]
MRGRRPEPARGDPMFIQTEATPNPSTLKFLPGRTVSGEGPLDFRNEDEARRSPLASALFAVEGVSSVMFGSDFVSVTKADVEWQHVKPAILGAIMEHFMSGAPLLDTSDVEIGEDEFFEEGDEETVSTIKELLESRIRPAVASDGGDITFRGFREGVVYLSMKGACAGCPSSTATLKNGIQNLLRHYLPDVQSVEQV